MCYKSMHDHAARVTCAKQLSVVRVQHAHWLIKLSAQPSPAGRIVTTAGWKVITAV